MPLTKDLLKKCSTNNIFVETGTWLGVGVELAYQAGFTEIHSIEIDDRAYEIDCMKFGNCDSIKLYSGDSRELLWPVIENIDECITFWLDAHGKYSKPDSCPLLQELDVISRHPIKNHTILIDDIDKFGKYGIDISNVKRRLKAINKQYHFREYSDCEKSTVLIAEEK